MDALRLSILQPLHSIKGYVMKTKTIIFKTQDAIFEGKAG